MSDKILATGGAGVIGSHLSRVLVQNGFSVCIIDTLTEQVHGAICIGYSYC